MISIQISRWRASRSICSVCVCALVVLCAHATDGEPEVGQAAAETGSKPEQPGLITFKHPKSWRVVEQEAGDEEAPIEMMVESKNGDRSLLVRVQPREGADQVGEDLEQLKAQGFVVTRTKPEPRGAVGQLNGVGTDYDLTKDGQAYRMYHLVTQFDFKHDVLIRVLTTESQWTKSKRPMKFMVDSITIGDLYQIEPDIEQPMMLDRELYSFEAPGNWHLNESDRKPFTKLEITAKQYSWFTATIHDRDLTAQKELEMYLRHSIDDQLVSHTEMNTWLGFQGVGVQGQLRDTLAGFQQFKALYIPLADGRLLVLKKYQAESSAELTDPGFELIESTFKLLVEPASGEPAIDP